MNVIVKKARPTQAQIIKELRAQVKDLEASCRIAARLHVAAKRKVSELTKALELIASVTAMGLDVCVSASASDKQVEEDLDFLDRAVEKAKGRAPW